MKRALVSSHCPGLRLEAGSVERLIETLDRDAAFDAPAGELSIVFLSKEEIGRLHADFMEDPSPTDVITFPGDPDAELAGEICVCPEVAYEYSQREGLPFSEELALYLIHGYLHLCGFDDVEERDRQTMRRAEKEAMRVAREREVLPQFDYQSEQGQRP